MNPYIKSLGSTDIMSGSGTIQVQFKKKIPNESPKQCDTLTFQIVTPLKESSQKWVTE